MNPLDEYKSPQSGGMLIEVLQTVVFALAVSVVVYLFFAIPNQVEGQSMDPNLGDSQILLTNKFIQIIGGSQGVVSGYDYQRGDIVVFQQPGKPDLVKRIIGMPGERVKIKDGRVIVNGNVLIEEYLPSNRRTEPGTFLPNGVEKRIPDDSYFVMGDNRGNSKDSRFSEVGFINRRYLKGSPFIRVFPMNDFGILPRGSYKEVPENQL